MGSTGDEEPRTTSNEPVLHPGDKHEVPKYEAHSSAASLKDRIKQHYDIASTYYYSLWGQHIHHGLFKSANETKEQAQVNLINFMLEKSQVADRCTVLDVGCGIGGTSRYLAGEHGCTVTGTTISSEQVKLATQITLKEASVESNGDGSTQQPDFISCGPGKVRFLELDAEKMLEYFSSSTQQPVQFDCVWISEALSHIPNKPLFFSSSFYLLTPNKNSKLVIADWFKSSELTSEQIENDIKPIEDGMLLPQLHTMDEYIEMAKTAGFKLVNGPFDISKDVAKTWDISWSLIASPSLWAFAISQGRDGLAFLQAFRAMRRGYANGSFRYGVLCFEKP